MTTEDHAARVEQILAEARESALVATTWTCSMDSEGINHYIPAQPPWWDKFAVGVSAGILYCLVLNWLFS
jgi:hypothetical protein